MSVNKDLLPSLKTKYPNVDFSDLEDTRLDVVQLDALVRFHFLFRLVEFVIKLI